MAEGSIKPALEFCSFKINYLNLQMKPIIRLLVNTALEGEWVFMQRFSDVIFIEDDDIYLACIGLKASLKEVKNLDKLHEDDSFIDIEGEISGVFRYSSSDELGESTKNNLICFQGPAILAPYLRAAISNLLAQSGFGNIIFPLMNIYEAAKGANVKIIKFKHPQDEQVSAPK